MSLLEADDFYSDWYGWLTNQLGHTFLGLFLYVTICLLHYAVVGEYPYRAESWFIIVYGYLFFEFAVQRGDKFWDSIEDSLFVSYGAGILAITFKEVEAGRPTFLGDNLEFIGASLVVFIIYLSVGCIIRIRRSKNLS